MRILDPHTFVVFGATGDLMQRKLMPALHDLLVRQNENKYIILGASRSNLSDEEFRHAAYQAMVEQGFSRAEADNWCTSHLFFHSLREQTLQDYVALRERIETLEREHDLPGNRVLYLALPPTSFIDTITKIGEARIAQDIAGWARIVIEKPFGHDLRSAKDLNALLHTYFREDQIFRIDHYLGKETVQNLMVFRFGNAIFESLWNRNHIESVDILVAEKLGVEGRAGYFDKSGTFRDMVQNHLTQILTLIAMEVPASTSADAIRYEKIKVLQSIEPLRDEDIVLGQYDEGMIDSQLVPAYIDEKGIPKDSTTETFVALRLRISNWRWQGVPFTIRTGKRLSQRLTRIAVTFHRPPVTLFKGHNTCFLTPNVLFITLQPDEGFSLSFDVKTPGEGFGVMTQNLQFRYEEAFGPLPDAYRTLLEDIIKGDQTLFVHAEEVEKAWALYRPILERRPPLQHYPSGSWGPDTSNTFVSNLSVPALT